MVKCPKCDKELSETAKFCDNCGTQIPEKIICPNCGKQTDAETAFCGNCGSSISENTVDVQTPADLVEKKKPYKKVFIFGGIAVIVAALVIAYFVFISGRSTENKYVFYVKDSDMYLNNLRENSDALQLTAGLYDTADIVNEYSANFGEVLGYFTNISKDSKYIFYPGELNVGKSEGISADLYYKEFSKKNAEAIQIDSDVNSYTVNNDESLVTYITGGDGNLYQYDLAQRSKEKIDSDVNSVKVSDDGKKIIYITTDNGIYLKSADQEKEKIASEASGISYVTEDFSTVYFLSTDGSLYKKTEGSDKVKIVSDAHVLKVYDSGEIYYLKSETEEIAFTDYVLDDKKEEDAAIIYDPRSAAIYSSNRGPQEPSLFNYRTYIEYEEAYEEYKQKLAEYEAARAQELANYNESCEAYDAKVKRDKLREDLKDESFEYTRYSLCYYDGTEETVITDAFRGDFAFENYGLAASDSPVICYDAYNQKSLEKVNISEIESVSDIRNMIEDALFSSSDTYIAVAENAKDIEVETGKDKYVSCLNSTGDIIYCFDNLSEGEEHSKCGTLYRITITDGVVGEAEEYDTEVYYDGCGFIGDTEIKYFKNYNGITGELYIDKKMIDSDVWCDVVKFEELGKIFYYTDWNNEKNYGTLKTYNGNESIKIDDDVHSYTATYDGRIFYLYDYSNSNYTGELYEWFEGETRKLDEDVFCLIPVSDYKLKGLSGAGKTLGMDGWMMNIGVGSKSFSMIFGKIIAS